MTPSSLEVRRPPVHPIIPALATLVVSTVIGAGTVGFALAIDLQLKGSYGILYKPFEPLEIAALMLAAACPILLSFLGYALLRIAHALEQSRL